MGSVFYEVVADATAVAHLIFILDVVAQDLRAAEQPDLEPGAHQGAGA